MSEAVIESKKQYVNEVAEELKSAESIVAVDYLGLTVAEVTDLRRQLREEGVAFRVIKNTMIRRAFDQNGVEYNEDLFHGPTALAISQDDATAPARILKNFSDDVDTLTIKGGFYDGEELTLEEINRFASLPGREGLLSMLLSVLQAPVRNVAYAVQAVRDKAEEEEA